MFAFPQELDSHPRRRQLRFDRIVGGKLHRQGGVGRLPNLGVVYFQDIDVLRFELPEHIEGQSGNAPSQGVVEVAQILDDVVTVVHLLHGDDIIETR